LLKRRRARIRSPTENYLEILEAVHNSVEVLNRIVYRVAIPWRRGKEMVNDLVEKGYLTKEKISAARYVYKMTTKESRPLRNMNTPQSALIHNWFMEYAPH